MRLTLDRLWVTLAVALPVLLALLVPLPAVDLAYQVRAGDEILRSGALPGVDTYTFTVAGTSWTDQQWLAQVILAVGHGLGGWELLVVLRAALIGLSITLLVDVAIVRGMAVRTAAVLALVAFVVAAPALALRPQLLGIALFCVLLALAVRRHRHPRAWWAAPVLIALWANVHGSFVLGPLLLGWAWLDDVARGRTSRGSLAVLVIGVTATLITPFGPGVWAYAAGIGTDPTITTQVSEWQRTSPFTVTGLLFYASALAVVGLAIRGRSELRWPDWLWLAGMVAIGAWAERGVAWWPFGAVLVVAPALARLGAGRPALRPNRLNGVVAAVLALAVIAALPWWRPAAPLTGRPGLLTYAPTDLALELREAVQPGDRVFVPQTWSSWFEWAVPDARYFVDSRFELFPRRVWDDYSMIVAGGPDSPAVLDAWAVQVMVIPVGKAAPPGWDVRFADGEGMILGRHGS